MLKIVVVEDEIRTRMGIVNVIKRYPELGEVIGVAEDGKRGLEMISQVEPDLVISDIKMPNMTGLEMIEALNPLGLKTKYILLTGYAEFEYARDAIRLNVASYLLKPIIVDDIISEIKKLEKTLSVKNLKFSVSDVLSDYLLDKISENDFFAIIKEEYARYMDKDFDMILIYIAFFSEDVKGIKKQIRAILEDMFTDFIVCFLSNNTILVLNFEKTISYDLFLSKIKSIISANVGLLYKEGVSFNNIYPEYLDMDKNIFTFLEMGIGRAILLDFGHARYSLDSVFIDTLIRKFKKSINEKDYDLCIELINRVFLEFEGKLYVVDDVIYYINSIWSIIIKESKDVLFAKNDKISFLRILNEYRKARIKEEYLRVFTMIFQVLKTADERNVYSRLVSKTLRKIKKEYMHPITLQEIAEQFDVTHIYLSKLFRDEIGEGFKDYLIRVRMEEAMYLLQSNTYKVSEVAEAVGYPNSKYFCTIFKKYTGISPSNYRVNER